jgi:transcriptional regulator with XRE-family HTH domain
MQLTINADTLAETVRILRFISGLTLPEVADKLENDYGYAASRELVRRIEAGGITADKIDPILAAYLADIFAVPIDEFCPEAAPKLEQALANLSRVAAVAGRPAEISRTGSRSRAKAASMAAHPSGGAGCTTPDPLPVSGDRSPLSVAA